MPQAISAEKPPTKTTKKATTKKATKKATTKKDTTEKATNAKKNTKPKKESAQASKLRNGGAAAYWGYKAFQALRVCSGDVTAVAEIATELLAEGACAGAVANPGMVVEAVEAVVDSYGGMKDFRRNVKNFAQFSGALSKQLNSDGKPQTDGKMMESSQRLYNIFVECDRDGSGGVSIEEYVYFCSEQGVPRSMAETTFFQADVDGDGQISFEEWTAMMAGRVGCDKKSFNCGGHHGLTEYVAVCNGLACDFCGAPIPARSRAKGCRRCDCDACAFCSGLSSSCSAAPRELRPLPPPPPPPPAAGTCVPSERPPAKAALFDCRLQHGLTLSTRPGGPPVDCDWCGASVPIGSPAVGCRVCDMDGCMDCAAVNLSSSPESSASRLTCHGRHGLVLMQATTDQAVTFRCNFCLVIVAPGAKLFCCRTCGVDACVACMWKDHRRALSTEGAFTCSQPDAHQLRTWTVFDQQQLRQRCDWCCGTSCIGQAMQRCDACDVDVCQACLVTLPEQKAKFARVKAAANAARMAAHLNSISINEAAGVRPGPGTSSLSPPSPPPGYGAVSAPSHGAPAAAVAAAVPANVPCYHSMIGGSAAEVSHPGATATATRMPTTPAGREKLPPPPSYSCMLEDVAAAPRGAGGRTTFSNAVSAPPASCSPEKETPLASAALGAARTKPDPQVCFGSVVRVVGVDDPEVDGKLLTVLGFEPCGDGSGTRDGVVVLQRRGKVVYVSASHVYKIID